MSEPAEKTSMSQPIYQVGERVFIGCGSDHPDWIAKVVLVYETLRGWRYGVQERNRSGPSFYYEGELRPMPPLERLAAI
jgi:hypothetical protein